MESKAYSSSKGAMNKVLHDCIPKITMPFLDDIPIKGCAKEEKNETMDRNRCRKLMKRPHN
jgi:hypothetical protein